MANHDSERPDSDQWIDDRLAGLQPGRDWTPNSGRAFARLKARSRARSLTVRRWLVTSFAAVMACVTLIMLPASRACAQQPGACVLRVLNVKPRPAAPVTLEIYIDFGSPESAQFVREVGPQLTEQYVRTGKIKLVYRNVPRPLGAYSELAARYADAAGELGYYGVAMKQLFATQQAWSASGNVDSVLTQAIPADKMEKLRTRVASLDRCIAADLAGAQADHPERAPFAVIVAGGERRTITGAPLTLDVLRDGFER